MRLERTVTPMAEAAAARARADELLSAAAAAALRVQRRYERARQHQLAAISLQWRSRRRLYDRLGTVVCTAADRYGLLDLEVVQPPDGLPAEVRAAGEIDISSSPSLEGCLSALLGRGCPVVIDLSGITFMDASGARVLLQAQSLAGRAATTLALRRPSRAVMRVLELRGDSRGITVEPPAEGVA